MKRGSAPTPEARFVTYRRVSTSEQGRSGLGLEAQQRDLDLYLGTVPEATVLAEFVEVVSGGKGQGHRPELVKALELCRREKAVLLVAKLDRLSRSVAFVANLLEDKTVEFKVAQLPRASRFELHLWAALAEQEREFVSQRTKAALAAAKERGVVLGGWRGGAGTVAMNQRRSAECDANFEQVKAMVAHLRERGASLREVVRHLDAYGVRTSDGTPYSLGQVHRVVKRLTKVDDSTTAVLTSS